MNGWKSQAAIVVCIGLAISLAVSACGAFRVWEASSSLSANWEGRPAPELVFRTLDGQRTRLSELRGHRVLLSLWATWCLPCRTEMPVIDELFAERRGEGGVQVFGLSFEAPSVIGAFAEEYGIRYPLASVVEAEIGAPYDGAPAFPTSFVIGPDGTIEAVHVGYLTKSALESLLWPGS